MGSPDQNNDKAGDHSPAFSTEETLGNRARPEFSLTIWPNRSMPAHGFRKIMIFTAGMLVLPLLPLLGTPVAIGLIPFLIAPLFLLWFFISKNYRDGKMREELHLWPDLISVTRFDPVGRKVAEWQANPFWVRTELYKEGRIENYLTLKGAGREIELGAFLSPEERVALRDDVDRAIASVR